MPVSPKQTKKNTLKRRCGKVSILLFVVAFALSSGFFVVPEVSAATGVNKQINFQGKVVNTDGTNVTNGDYDFVFKIYSVDTGGTEIWTETRTGGNQVTVTDGIFQVNLGSVTALPGSVDFNTDNIYLGIEFNSDGEMSPRVRFTAAPYAMNADKVHGLTVTDTTGTLTIPNGETISFGGSFTTTASNDLTLTTSGATSVTLPTTGTLATLAGTEEFTNKTIGSTGLIFSGATTDITTASGESLVIVAAGAGTIDIQDATTVDSLTTDTGGISIASGQSYTGAGAVTLSSATASDLTINSGTTGTIYIGTDVSAETINIGNTGAAVKTIAIGNNSQANTITIGDASATSVSITDNNWSIGTGGAASFTSITSSGAIAANGGITFDNATDTVGAFTGAGTINMNANILENIGNTGTDFIASTGALTLAGVLTANGGITLAGSQSFTASALSYIDLGSITHSTTAVQGVRLPQAASASPSSPSSGEGYLAWDSSGNQLIVYNGSSWGTVGGGSQTPWTSDISAAGYDLGSLSNLGFQETTGAPTGTDVGFYRDNTGDLTGNVLTGKTFNLAVNGTDEYNFSSSALAMNSNNITGLGTNLTATGALTIATGTATALTLDSGTTGTISIGSDSSAETINFGTGVAVKTIVIGNSTDDSFTLNSSGLNVTSGGALTGVASIDTISVSSTALTFAGVGTLASGGSSGLTIDSASGVVAVATGDYLSLSHSGVSGAAAGYIWYDSSDNKFKINESGTTKILCNTTDAGCGGGSSDLQTTYGNDADGSNVTISLTAADDGLIITNPSSGGNDLSSFTLQVSQQHTTAAIAALDISQSSNAANAVNITANSIDTETGLSITTNGLTSGKGLSVASSTTTFTGDLAGITLSGSDASNTGNVFAVSNTGSLNTNTSFFVNHEATGTNNLAVRVNDVASDTTPFVIDGTGKVGVGTTTPARAMDIFESASAPQLRLSKDLTNYSEMTVDSAGDLQLAATGTDIRALSENLWVCDNDACPALTLTGDGNIFVENVIKFGNGVYLKNDSATELSVYDNDDNTMLIFDEQ